LGWREDEGAEMDRTLEVNEERRKEGREDVERKTEVIQYAQTHACIHTQHQQQHQGSLGYKLP
jgi:hypothetical protein